MASHLESEEPEAVRDSHSEGTTSPASSLNSKTEEPCLGFSEGNE